MANKKDVELVIRAKDEAKKQIQTVAGAIEDLVKIQNDLVKSAGKTDSVIGSLGLQFAALNKQAAGLSALDKIAGQLNTAGAAFERMESSFRGNSSNLKQLIQTYRDAGSSVATLKKAADEAAATFDRQNSATAASKKELDQLDRQVEQAANAYKTLVAELRKIKNPTEQQNEAYRTQLTSLNALLIAQERAKAVYASNNAALKVTKTANNDAANALEKAQGTQTRLYEAVVKATTALSAQRNEVLQQREALSGAVSAATSAATAFGAVALNQKAISEASKAAAADLNKVSAALNVQKAPAPSKEGLQSPRLAGFTNAQQDLAKAQAAAIALSRAMKTTSGATDELAAAYAIAQQRIAEANAALRANSTSLKNVESAAKGSYKAFDDGVTGITRVAQVTNAAAQATERAARQSTNAGLTTRQYAAAAGAASGQTNNLASAFNTLYGESRKSMSVVQRLRGELLSLVTGYVGLYAAMNQVGTVVTAFQTLEAAQNRLGSVFGQNQARVAEEIAYLQSEAARLGISFAVLSDEYSKFTIAAQAANYSTAETRKIFKSVSEAARVNKLSVEQTSGVFLALTQMISKGTVSSEELRRQLGDRLSGAFNIFATAIGKSTAELDKMMRAGQVTADSETLLKFATELDKRFGPQLTQSLKSLTTQIGQFGNSVYNARLQVAQGGFAEALTEGLTTLNEQFQSRAGVQFFTQLGASLGDLVRILVQVPQYFDEIATAVRAILTLKFTQFIIGVGKASAASAAQLLMLARATAATGTGLGQLVAEKYSRALFGMTATITAARVEMMKLSGASIVARTSLATVIGVTTIARAAFTTAAVAARALWSAIGGPVGIAIAGLVWVATEVASQWKTTVEKATDALDQHESIVNEVKKAYDRTRDAADEFGKKASEVTKIEIEINTRELQASLQDLRDELTIPFKAPGFENLQDDFQKGKLNADQLRQGIAAIAKANPNLRDGYIKELIETANRSEKLENAIARNNASLKSLNGTASEAEKKLAGVGGAVTNLDDAMKDSTAGMDKWQDSLKSIQELIPSMANEFDRLKKLAKLDDVVASMTELSKASGVSLEDVQKAMEAVKKARDEINTEAANKSVSGNYVSKLIGAESSGNTNAKNPNSSATGLGQFVESTWTAMFKKYFPDRAAGLTDAAIAELRTNAELMNKMIELYAQENAKVLQNAGLAVDDAALYMAHFLGPNGAVKVLKAAAETPIKALLSQKAINANPKVLGGDATAGSVRAFTESKMGTSDREVAVAQELQQIDKKKQDDAEKFLETLNEQNAQRRFEIQNLQQSAREQAIAKVLQDSEVAAKKAGVELTQAQRTELQELAALQYDIANKDKIASEAKAAAEKEVNDLLEFRKSLMEQIQFYQDNGNTAAVGKLNEQLLVVNDQLEIGIANAIAYWESVGGTEAQSKIAQLNTQMMTLNQTANEYLKTGKQINQDLSAGGADAFVQFADSIAEGNGALQSLSDAFRTFAADFLKMIAKMIIQQMIFNAISGGAGGGGGAGGAISGFLGSLFHTGGIAGSNTAQKRPMNPAWFANAARYHTGGIAGLKPNEVPAVLEKGEEILTDSDPRHMANGGMQAAAAPNIKIVNTIDSGDFVSQGLSSKVGETALLNTIRTNSKAVRAAIGV